MFINNWWKKKICQLVFTGIIILSLGGCKAKEKEEVIEITLMHGWGGTMKTHEVMQEIYDEFSKENKDIHLTSLPSSDSKIVVEKANDMLAVDKMPDIISTNGLSYYVENAVKRKMALNLMPYIEQDKDFKEAIHPFALSSWTVNGNEIYTIPDALEVIGYWYNESYFKEAGIIDSSGQVVLPATWDEFFRDCKKLQNWIDKEGKEISVFALDTKVEVIEGFFFARLAGTGERGMELVSDVPDSFDVEEIRKTIKDIKKLYNYSRNVDSKENARQSFQDGKSVMYFNGVWESDVFRGHEIESKIQYANYPTESGKSVSYVSPSSGYVIYDNPDERKKEASVRFLKYMLSDKVQTKIALETGQAPSNPSVDLNKIISVYPLLGKALEKAHQADIQIKVIRSVWKTKAIETLMDQIYVASQNEVACEQLIQTLNRYGTKTENNSGGE